MFASECLVLWFFFPFWNDDYDYDNFVDDDYGKLKACAWSIIWYLDKVKFLQILY
jgi:hypothetical protein